MCHMGALTLNSPGSQNTIAISFGIVGSAGTSPTGRLWRLGCSRYRYQRLCRANDWSFHLSTDWQSQALADEKRFYR
jgi:hypothetical protein